jgi:hypothetical protein
MTPDAYLENILARETVNTGLLSPARGVQAVLQPVIQSWAGRFLHSIQPSGSFAKGTANQSGTDIDLFVSLTADTGETLKEIYESLATRLRNSGYSPRLQNVSLNIKVGTIDVDLVPAKRQDDYSEDHSLYRRRADTWTKTNVAAHIAHVRAGGRIAESRLIKLWRDQKGLDFPSFYIEMTVMAALRGSRGSLSQNVLTIFRYLRDTFPNARVIDPANTNNIISDDLTAADKGKIKAAAERALTATNWNQIVI